MRTHQTTIIPFQCKKIVMLTIGLAIFASDSAVGASRKVPQFSSLKTSSRTALECTFDITANKPEDSYVGRFKLMTTGEAHLLIQPHQEPLFECKMRLTHIEDGTGKVISSFLLLAKPEANCLVQIQSRYKNADITELEISSKRANQRSPLFVETGFLPGKYPCNVEVRRQPEIARLVQRQW